MNDWLDSCLSAARTDPAAATKLRACRRLIKGASDTHARGLSKFAQVMEASKLVLGHDDATARISRLREAALRDEKGEERDGAVGTIRSFAQ